MLQSLCSYLFDDVEEEEEEEEHIQTFVQYKKSLGRRFGSYLRRLLGGYLGGYKRFRLDVNSGVSAPISH